MENFIKEIEVSGINLNVTLGDDMVGYGLKKDENGVVSLDIIEENLVKITYSELKSLRDNSQLTPGSFYRITDYVTTTTQSETKSANHPFDVIVLALSENTLSEDAKAILHEGDTYFADSDLSAWELKYCLDNDKTRFGWADETNGKGVIYRMIDEKRNDCPYDFKNILFYNTILISYIIGGKYYYTFSYMLGPKLYDGTTEKQVKKCYGNVMGEYYNDSGVLQLNKNVFGNILLTNLCHSNTFGNNCYSNTFGDRCYSNTFGNNCRYNTLGDECYSNTFEDSCENNTLGHSGGFNTFSNNCTYNTIGYDCQYNTFGTGCYFNTFGNECSRNTFGKTCHHNTFGNGLQNRSLDSDKTSITLNEEYYDDGSGQLVPTKHPDLSTQPNILPYKFMGQYVYEQLIPVNKGDRVVNNEFAVETPMIISAKMFGANSFKNVNILAVKSNALLLDTSSEMSEISGYINIKYTDSSILLHSGPSGGYYYGSTSTQPSNNFPIDFGITEDGTVYMYDNDILTLSKNGEIISNSIPTQYKDSSKVIIDDNVTSIGDSAFYNCRRITSMKIGNSVTSIGKEAFYYCSGLTSVEIGNSVTSIGNDAFSNCTSLTSVTIPNNVTSIGNYAFSNCTSLTSVTIPNSVTSIGKEAFEYCTSLTSVTIPNNVTSIGDNAFSNCTSLTSVTIPNSVTNISISTFYNTAWYNNQHDGIVYLDNYLLGYKGTMPSNASIEIKDGTLLIANGAFKNCIGLTSVTIPNSVTSIGNVAFQNCSSLTSVTIPNSVTSIGGSAFENCIGLTSVTIPNSVTSIGSFTFYNCTGLTSITCKAINPPSIKSNVFKNVNKTIPLYVPAESVETYKSANYWSEFTNIQAINE